MPLQPVAENLQPQAAIGYRLWMKWTPNPDASFTEEDA